jgi:hypothetical protein
MTPGELRQVRIPHPCTSTLLTASRKPEQ